VCLETASRLTRYRVEANVYHCVISVSKLFPKRCLDGLPVQEL